MAEFAEGAGNEDLLQFLNALRGDFNSRVDTGALFGVGDAALRPIFKPRNPSDENVLAREVQKAMATLPDMGNPRIEGRDARLREGDYPDSNRTLTAFPQPTPEDRALQLTALGIGGGASASYRGGPGMAKVDGPKRYDVEGFLKRLEALPLPKQREALAALQAANPEVNRQNFTGKNDVAMRGVSDALLSMAGGLADPNKSFAQALTGAGERGFKSYDEREDKAVKEQMAARLERLAQGKELNAADLADYGAQAGKLTTLGKGYGDLNQSEVQNFTAKSNDAYHRAMAGMQSAALGQRAAALGAAGKQKEALLEMALNAEGKSLMGRKGYALAGNKDILVASMALLGKEAKHGEDDDLKASDLKSLGDSVYATDLQAALGYIPDARTIKGFAEGKLRLAIDPLTKKQTLVAP